MPTTKSLKDRPRVTPEDGADSGIQMTEEQQAGVRLAYFLLGIISVILLISCCLFMFIDFDSSDEIYEALNPTNVSDSVFEKKVEQVRQMVQEKKDYREFVARNLQYIIGVLLPVLTSILGYIFGTRSKRI